MDVGTKEGVKWIQGPERELGGSRDQREVRNHQFSLCVVLSSVEKKGWVQSALFCPLRRRKVRCNLLFFNHCKERTFKMSVNILSQFFNLCFYLPKYVAWVDNREGPPRC